MLIESRQFFCPSAKRQVIFEAMLQKTDVKTAEEIRNTTQKWVLKRPMMVIAGKAYQVDPYCSVVIPEVGDTSCDAILPSHLTPDSDTRSSIDMTFAYSIGGASLLVVVIVAVVIIIILLSVYIAIRRRSKRAKYSVR